MPVPAPSPTAPTPDMPAEAGAPADAAPDTPPTAGPAQPPKPTPPAQPRNPLHGMTLEAILTALVDAYGWEGLGARIPIRCFTLDPSLPSSLKFLRKTPWAREKVESLYLFMLRDVRRQGQPAQPRSAQRPAPPRPAHRRPPSGPRTGRPAR